MTLLVWSGKGVLVTGGAGFIGSHLVSQLASVGADVVVLDNLSSGRRENLTNVSGIVTLKHLDLRDVDWSDLFAGRHFDVIFHLAANAYVPPSVENPIWDYEVNLGGTIRLLEALRTMQWPGSLIYASSAAVYGDPVHIPMNESDLTVPISPYGVGKLAAERYVAVFSHLYGLRAASLRIFSVYGPRQRKQVIFDLIDKLAHDSSELFIHGDGSQVRDFNFVEDTARAMMIVAEHAPLHGEVYNVASGRECSIRELATTLCRISNVSPRLVFSGSVRPGDPEKWVADISGLMTLGYNPRITLEEGLRRTFNWYSSAENSVSHR
jgi:UDP-glucose 4-epimerase